MAPSYLRPDEVSTLPEPRSYLLITGNLMKSGCCRHNPSVGIDQELKTALEMTVKRASSDQDTGSISDSHEWIIENGSNELVSTLPGPNSSSSSSSGSGSGSSETLLKLASGFEKYQVPSASPPPEPALLDLPSPTRILMDQKYMEKVVTSERSELDVPVKLFLALEQATPFIIHQAIQCVCLMLKTPYIDSLVISLYSSGTVEPAIASSSSEPGLDILVSLWPYLHSLKASGLIRKALGVCDLDLPSLTRLLDMTVGLEKPAFNQIRVPNCHTLDQDLVDYGKSHHMETTVHKDPHVILSSATLDSIFQENGILRPASDKVDMKPSEPEPRQSLDSSPLSNTHGAHKGSEPEHPVKISWIARYNFFIRARSVMSNKGYIVSVV